MKVLRKIRNIYRYERVISNLNRETQGAVILQIRREKIEPIIDELLRLTSKALADGEVMLESAFANAISYMHNRGAALKTFLTNPWLHPDNGESERALRPVSIGRKNWLFFGSEKGGQAAGILMSLVQTCRGMNINVLEYLEDVLRRINGHPHSKLYELLPGNWKKAESYYNRSCLSVKYSCKASNKRCISNDASIYALFRLGYILYENQSDFCRNAA